MIPAFGKLVWLVLVPSHLLLGTLTVALLLAARGRRGARPVAALALAALLAAAILPLGLWLQVPLERRFRAPDPAPAYVDGIVVLGGGIDLQATAAWGQPALGATAERFLAPLELVRRWPAARLVFAGGVAPLSWSDGTEAAAVADLYDRLGFGAARLLYEDRSATTRENALFAKDLVAPRPGETWLLVTSAAHMPRAVGAFRAVGWPVVAWPVDYRTTGGVGPWAWRQPASERLAQLDDAAREWVGLLWYRLLGWTDALFPAP
jgi:uncharacterized SAM-binding protein YcdF (DUF218 family)